MEVLLLNVYLLSFAIFAGIYYLTRFLVAGILHSKNVSLRDSYEFVMRFVSCFHCVPVFIFSMHCLLYQDVEPLFGHYKYSGLVSSFSAAYFTWDMIIFSVCDYKVAVKHKHFLDKNKNKSLTIEESRFPLPIGGAIYIAHHILGIFGQGLTIYYGNAPLFYAIMLSTEFTQVFINSVWMMDTVHYPTPMFLKIMIPIGWIVFRLIGGGYCFYILVREWDLIYSTFSIVMLLNTVISVSFLNIVNWFWWFKILRKIRKGLKAASARGE